MKEVVDETRKKGTYFPEDVLNPDREKCENSQLFMWLCFRCSCLRPGINIGCH